VLVGGEAMRGGQGGGSLPFAWTPVKNDQDFGIWPQLGHCKPATASAPQF
jgi:hypothetical protein